MSSSSDPTKQATSIIIISIIFLALGVIFGLKSAAGMIFAFMGVVGCFYGIRLLTSYVKDKSDSFQVETSHKLKSHHLRNREIDVDNNEILITKFRSGKLEKFHAAIDFKAFYKELHHVLVYNKSARLLDRLGEERESGTGKFFNNQTSFSEHFDPGRFRTRTGDMFETKFTWNKRLDGSTELEIAWECQTPLKFLPGYNWCEIHLDIISRDMVEKEVLVGNTKKVLNQGGWEIRNRYAFRSKIVPDLLNKIPIIRSSPFLKAAVINYFYMKKIELDLDEFEHKVIPFVQAVFTKHMAQ